MLLSPAGREPQPCSGHYDPLCGYLAQGRGYLQRHGGRRGSWNRTAPHGSTRSIRGSSCRSTRRKAALTSRSRTCPNTWTRPNATASMPSSSPAGPYGGQDRGLPNFSVDPRLGTAEEFRKVIADAQKKGGEYPALHQIHVGRPDDRIPREVPAAPCDQCVARSLCASGVQLQHLYAVDRRQYAPLQHPLHDGRRAAQHAPYRVSEVSRPRAAGMVYDENQHHAGAMLCFDPNHGHRVPGFNYQGADKLGREFYEMCQKSNPRLPDGRRGVLRPAVAVLRHLHARRLLA